MTTRQGAPEGSDDLDAQAVWAKLPAFSAQASGASELGVAADARWWPAVAALVRVMGARSSMAENDFGRIVVIVPRMSHAPLLRSALHAALDGAACLAPRVYTLETWADVAPGEDVRQRAELLGALRQSAWVRERFGTQAAALWSLAADIATLGDELTLAASSAAEAFEGRWLAAVERNFSQRAAAAGDAQAQLVLALWRAGLSQGLGVARLREALAVRAQQARGPLIWLVPQGASSWQRAYCRAYAAASGQRACLVTGDSCALARDHPWLGAAWPELGGSPAPVPPIAARASAMPPDTSGAPQLEILRRNTLEEEAAAAAAWVVDQLCAGHDSIALIALDRLTARRVRALLDRARIRVADEAGWKLSTTSAAAALMRWIDVVASDFEVAQLLDWLRSPFTLAQYKNKTNLGTSIASVLLAGGVVGGISAVRAALWSREQLRDASEIRSLMQQLFEHARQWQRRGTLGSFLSLTLSTLEHLGMRPALGGDAVGRNVLEAVEALHEQLRGSNLRLDLAEFRAFLAGHFEQLTSRDRPADSPVVMTTLAGARLRRFKAALLIGADADHLPARRPSGGLLAPSIRRELGLRTEADDAREQTQDLAALLATTPFVAATWRAHQRDEPLPLSPLLERLQMLRTLAGCETPHEETPVAWQQVPPRVSLQRSVRAPQLLPGRISASSYQNLVECPYRFFGLRMLGLREAPRLATRPDKRDLGMLLHSVLLEFHAQEEPHQSAKASVASRQEADAALTRLQGIVDAHFANLLGQRPALIGYRQRLRQMLPGYLYWLRQTQREGWHWQLGELTLQRAFALDDGTALQLEGRIDRLDEHSQGRRRVLDYKVRDATSLRRQQRDPGEDVQLLFYGLLADPPVQEAAYVSMQRPPDPLDATTKVVTIVAAPEPFTESVRELETRLRADLSRIAQGAPLAASGTETVCRRCELRSLCRHGFTVPEGASGCEQVIHE